MFVITDGEPRDDLDQGFVSGVIEDLNDKFDYVFVYRFWYFVLSASSATVVNNCLSNISSILSYKVTIKFYPKNI